MTALLLDPHGDDGVLFAAFTIMQRRPHVAVVLRSVLQEQRGTGITAAERERETGAALSVLDAPAWEQWPIRDDKPDWVTVKRLMEQARDDLKPDRVFAPSWEVGGHDHHNAVAEIAAEVFGPDMVTGYLTYVRGSARSDWATEVVPEPIHIIRKHVALSCFESQIREPSTRPWFMDGLREWVA